jgi:hypothetical protein
MTPRHTPWIVRAGQRIGSRPHIFRPFKEASQVS